MNQSKGDRCRQLVELISCWSIGLPRTTSPAVILFHWNVLGFVHSAIVQQLLAEFARAFALPADGEVSLAGL